MRKYTLRTNALLIALLVIPFLVLTMGQSEKRPITPKVPKDKQLPIVDFDAEEPADLELRAKGRAKASRYDGYRSQVIQDAPWMSSPIIRIRTTHWYQDLSALPIAKSDTAIIGTVTQAQAHLSNDKTAVYSDFNVQVEEILKDGLTPSVRVRSALSAERYGGVVRFRSGSIQRYEVMGQAMPRVGGRYLLFLKRLDQERNFLIITGYDVTGQTVSPLDGSEVEEGDLQFPFDKYRGFDRSAFLELVRIEVAQTNRN